MTTCYTTGPSQQEVDGIDFCRGLGQLKAFPPLDGPSLFAFGWTEAKLCLASNPIARKRDPHVYFEQSQPMSVPGPFISTHKQRLLLGYYLAIIKETLFRNVLVGLGNYLNNVSLFSVLICTSICEYL